VRPSVLAFTSFWTSSTLSPRSRATRLTCRAAYAGLMSGSSPLPLAVTASGGTWDGATPSSAATALRRSSTAATRSALFGPRFDPDDVEAS